MTPDYAFYRNVFLGEDIPEPALARAVKRAADLLGHWRHRFRVEPRPNTPNAEANALCAVAEALYAFAKEDERRGLTRVSVGSVSESYAAPAELCPETLAARDKFCLEEANYYMTFGRWLDAS